MLSNSDVANLLRITGRLENMIIGHLLVGNCCLAPIKFDWSQIFVCNKAEQDEFFMQLKGILYMYFYRERSVHWKSMQISKICDYPVCD